MPEKIQGKMVLVIEDEPDLRKFAACVIEAEGHRVLQAENGEEGLELLNGIRKERNIGWDDLVLDGVCAHYGLDRLVVALPKAYIPERKSKEKQAARRGWKG